MAVMKQVLMSASEPQYPVVDKPTASRPSGVKSAKPSVRFEQAERDDNYTPQPTEFVSAVIQIQLLIFCNYKNKNWLQFLFIVKAAVLKQQISKLYPQIQRTEARDHIYFSQRPYINVKAIFCA